MPNLLMNTVGSSMTNPYIMRAPSSSPNPNIANQTAEVSPVDDKHKTTGNSGLLTAGLCGLGVLGAAFVGVKCYRNNKLLRQISELRNSLRSEYILARNSVVETFNKEGLPESFYKEKFHDKKYTSGKDIREVKAFYTDAYEKLLNAKNEAVQNVKTALARVSDDKEWRELRLLRKQLLKDKEGKDINKYDVALRKIPLINDMLALKLHPEQENIFRSRTSATVDDVRALLKQNFETGADFDAEYSKLKKFDVIFDPMENFFVNNSKLSLLDLFRVDVETHDFVSDKLNLVKLVLEEDIPFVEKTWHENLSALAEDFRKKPAVQNLKKLIASK